MSDCFKSLEAIGIIPVVVINDAAGAVPLARALVEGGIPTAEVTFRTEAAPAAIAALAQQVPELLVGAGTVTSAEMARQAVDAGAKYIVSPGLNPAVVRWCLEHEVPVLPGVATPTEVEAALGLGLQGGAHLRFNVLGGVADAGGALQQLGEGFSVQAVQPDFKFSALLRHQGEESQPPVVVGEDRSLGRLALEIGEGDETGVQKIHGFLVVPLVVKPPQIGVVGVELRLPSVVQVEGIHQQQGGVFVERFREDAGDHLVGVL